MSYLLKYTKGQPSDPVNHIVFSDVESPGDVIQKAWSLFGTDIYIVSIEEVE